MPFWFGFRQVVPKPPGSWIGSGPFSSYEAAKAAYEREKLNWDAQVLPPFEAETEAEANRIAQERG